MPVNAVDQAGSPQGGFDGSGLYIRRRVLVPWSDIDNYSRELLPPSTVSGSTINQFPGASLAGFTGFIVSSYSWEPYFGDSDRPTNPQDCGTAAPSYEFARFNIEYRIPSFPISSGGAASRGDPVPFLQHRMTSGGDVLNLEQGDTNGRWFFETANEYVPEGVPIPKFVGTTQHDLHWPKVPKPNWPNLELFKGSVNDAPFKLRNYEYPAEQLLYLNYDSVEVVMTDGNVAYDLTIHFSAKSVEVSPGVYGGHNHYWNGDLSRWERVVLDTDSTVSPYPRNNFANLFTAGS